jgi:hypothetical protein
MAISTYAELLTALENHLDRSDLDDRLPEFVVIGEARIGREVKAKQMEQRVSTTPTDKYVSVPADFVSIRGVRIEGTLIGWMDYVSPDLFFQTFASSNTGTSNKYTIFGDELIFPTTPTGDVELWYYKKLTALATTTNTLFTVNPDLYLYAALTASAPYLLNDKRIPVWEGLYRQAKDSVNAAHEAGRFPAGLRMQVG